MVSSIVKSFAESVDLTGIMLDEVRRIVKRRNYLFNL